MTSPAKSDEGSADEKSASILRRSNKSANHHDQHDAVRAQQDLNRPENAKGRPPSSGPTNAGNDGGA
jgi:hypothetical protein